MYYLLTSLNVITSSCVGLTTMQWRPFFVDGLMFLILFLFVDVMEWNGLEWKMFSSKQ